MSFKIKNWKLSTLALIFFLLFISLGCWQLSRATEKKQLIESYEMRMQHKPLGFKQLDKAKSDLRFFKATLKGRFDNKHTFLLDNKTQNGRIGYEVYTPFKINGSNTRILVNRGFIAIKNRRSQKPKIKPAKNPATITGLINLPPAYFALGQINESTTISWPMIVEYIAPDKLAGFLNYPLNTNYVVQLEAKHPAAYEIKWDVVIMKPEKHQAYALQWFAFALTLLVLFFALNRR